MLSRTDGSTRVKRINLQYNVKEGDASALRLVLTLKPDWEPAKDKIKFTRFTDGITNTLLKAEMRQPGLPQHEIDQEAILLRAYGNGTHVLIDRERECLSHSLCASFGLAPPLLARFDNGLLYKFIEGQVTSPADMRRPDVSLAIARRLAEWHARIPVSAVFEGSKDEHASFTPDAQSPNLWTVLSRWISGLPSETDAQSAKKATLAGELPWLHKHLSDIRGIGPDPSGLVFSHCDLLSGNVIVLPTQSNGGHSSDASPASTMSSEASSLADAHASGETSVSFIDYEYATPAPAAFDIANHFAEWGGFDCDFSVIPNVQQRRDFITSYVDSYHHFRSAESESDVRTSTARPSEDVETLMAEVDRFRGAPGFYWGIWALIQAQISQISFDYASYAEVRLGEYWAWKRTVTEQGAELHRTNEEQQAEQIREKRWLQEA